MIDLSSNTNIPINEKAAAYLRVSKWEQAKEGYSLPSQEKMARGFCDKNGLLLDKSYIFTESKPASKIEQKNADISLEDSLNLRPELKKLLDLAQKKQFTHLVILSRDRLARDFEQFLAIKFILSKNNIKIHYSKEGENFNSSDEKINRFLDNILANVAELESNVISSRVKSGTNLLVIRGLWPGGKAPFGYELKDKRTKSCKLIPSSIQDKIKVQEIFKYYQQGHGYRKIAQMMNEKYNEITWQKSKIESIIKNKTYTGYIYWDRRGGRRHPGRHDEGMKSKQVNEELCYISEVDWDESSDLRKKRTISKDPRYFDTPFLLKDKLFCGKCGQKLITKNYGNVGGVPKRVYKCPTASSGKSELIIPIEKVEEKFIEKFIKDYKDESLDNQWCLYMNHVEEHKLKIKLITSELEEKVKTIDILRHNIREIYKEKLEVDILERIEFQDDLLSKTKIKYEKEITQLNDSYNAKCFTSKDDYRNAVSNFLEKFFNLETTLHQRRQLIDILVDQIIVSDSDGSINDLLVKSTN